jgi:hypothetical protein
MVDFETHTRDGQGYRMVAKKRFFAILDTLYIMSMLMEIIFNIRLIIVSPEQCSVVICIRFPASLPTTHSQASVGLRFFDSHQLWVEDVVRGILTLRKLRMERDLGGTNK